MYACDKMNRNGRGKNGKTLHAMTVHCYHLYFYVQQPEEK